MATQQRSGSSRTKKTAAPQAGKQPPENLRTSSAKRNEAESNGGEAQSTEVTGAALERREIPSFSISREARIAEAAYWRAERRGFTGGQELDDWLAAEREVDGDGAQ